MATAIHKCGDKMDFIGLIYHVLLTSRKHKHNLACNCCNPFILFYFHLFNATMQLCQQKVIHLRPPFSCILSTLTDFVISQCGLYTEMYRINRECYTSRCIKLSWLFVAFVLTSIDLIWHNPLSE